MVMLLILALLNRSTSNVVAILEQGMAAMEVPTREPLVNASIVSMIANAQLARRPTTVSVAA